VDFLKDKVECWMVWQRAPDASAGGRPYLVAVDMTEEQAKLHKLSVEHNGGAAIIEKSWVNHLYGESMTVDHGPFRSMMAEFRNKAKGG
jgi:hypothetical protein